MTATGPERAPAPAASTAEPGSDAPGSDARRPVVPAQATPVEPDPAPSPAAARPARRAGPPCLVSAPGAGRVIWSLFAVTVVLFLIGVFGLAH